MADAATTAARYGKQPESHIRGWPR